MSVDEIVRSQRTHDYFNALRRLIREVEVLDEIPVDLKGTLIDAIENVNTLKPLPSAEVIRQMFHKLGQASLEVVPQTQTTLQSYGRQRCGLAHEVAAPEAMQLAEESLQKLQGEYSKYPLLSWFMEGLLCDFQDNQNFGLFTYDWASFPAPHSEEDFLAYPLLICALQSGDATKAHCVIETAWTRTPGFRWDVSQCVREFLLDVAALKASLNKQAAEAAQIRNKVLAACMSIAIGGIHLLGIYVNKRLE